MAGDITQPNGYGPPERYGAGVPQPWEQPGYPAAGGYGDDDEPTVQWGRYLAALRRYKWLILLITVLGTTGGVIATRFLTPEYAVRSTIWVQSAPDRNGPIRAEGLLESLAWLELLKTGVVLDSVALRLGLYLEPKDPADSTLFAGFSLGDRIRPGEYQLRTELGGTRYTLRSKEGLAIESGAVGDSIGRPVGFRWAPPPEAFANDRDRTVTFTVMTPREASSDLASRLFAEMPKDGNFMRLSLTGEHPVRMAETLNAVMAQFVSVAADLKNKKLQVLTETLEEQLQYAQNNLAAAEGRLESFKVRTITLPTEGTPLAAGLQSTQPQVLTNFTTQKFLLEDLRNDRMALERAIQLAQGGQLSVEAFYAVPAVRNSPDLMLALQELGTKQAELRSQLFKFTPEHKLVRDIQDRINTLRSQTIPGYANNLLRQLSAQEDALDQRISSTATELQQIPTRTITEQRLVREQASAANLFLLLQNRHEEAKLALKSAIPDISVLEEAEPPSRPSSNSAPMIVLMGFAGSMAAAIALAILLDHLDKRFRYPDQVERELGLTILGAVPAIRKGKQGRSAEDAAQVVEAFRGIRLNLSHSYGAAGPVLLTVTSPSPGDGKSFISANLALSFAESGYNTLLLDGDIRRGEQHRMFSIHRRPGLIDHLLGESTLEEVLRPTTHKGLTVLPCGVRRHHGPELLGSGRMTTLMGELKARYDVIIVDSPPLGAGIDPFVLSAATGHMLVVLRSGETDRQLAEAKLKLVERLPVRVLGAVLNDIRAEGAYRYYSYVYGYAADEDSAIGQLVSGSREEEEEENIVR